MIARLSLHPLLKKGMRSLKSEEEIEKISQIVLKKVHCITSKKKQVL
jgi:hypothetical protein